MASVVYDLCQYDYLDIGCGEGLSLHFGRDKFLGQRGSGCDLASAYGSCIAWRIPMVAQGSPGGEGTRSQVAAWGQAKKRKPGIPKGMERQLGLGQLRL